MGVRPSLPVEGVEIILGNNLAGECVWPVIAPSPIVTPSPISDQGCHLISAQREDPGLRRLFDAVVPAEDVESTPTGYFIEEGVLLRKWLAPKEECGGESLVQVVIPEKFRHIILELSHGDIAGHLGVRKTYDRVLQHFYWPLLKKEISQFIKTCHTCQVTGKPNQSLKQAPLCPIPPVEQPFGYLLIDCVGPLPPSRSGSKFLLTVMCQSTRYPAAYAMRNITTRSVVKAQFISIFGIPKVIQSDQGSNFTSKMFADILKQLGVQHRCSSAFHPQSQGALERFHQTLKSLLRAYFVELNRDWEEGLPWLLLAAREVTHSSLNFSPNDLVFGHKVRGPLAVVGEQLKGKQPPKSLLEYVNGFRRRLFMAGHAARKNLEKAQSKMKKLFDRHSEQRIFYPGDQVLALLPLMNSPFCAKFMGPYTVVRVLSDLDYEIATPDRRKTTQVCHVNLLKPFFSRDDQIDVKSSVVVSPVIDGLNQSLVWEEEGVKVLDDAVMQPRLKNSETLKDLERLLSHLSRWQRAELSQLIGEFSSLFGDVPSQTHLIEHDVDVGDASPICQRFYRVPIEKRQKLETEIQYMLENNIAKPSSSSWASPCLLVRKSDGTQRFCTDYQKINKITKPDAFPLPRMDDCVDQVGSAKYVSKFDLLKGYWQVPLTPRAQEITAFITSSGLYSYSVMSFGLRNAPATFQRLMNGIVSGLEGCAVYLDDVVIFSDDWVQHVTRIQELFRRLVEAKLTVNLAKCDFARATVSYLGKEVGQGVVRPLRAEGASRFEWTSHCQKAFENVKLLLTATPVLAAPQSGLPFEIQVDASQVGAGAVLLQTQADGLTHPDRDWGRAFGSPDACLRLWIYAWSLKKNALTNQITRKDAEKAVSKWLIGARDRGGYRNARARAGEQNGATGRVTED
ncbi:hypothetical protein QQF64_019768 [Cirrhinus molitorella]|uniref:Gypsy retrotransposon integrase-like protein 1 n=2 Tax=Cirrhinus molitorella TaxID=172907 RepID=A0ABR3LGD8_9TELE